MYYSNVAHPVSFVYFMKLFVVWDGKIKISPILIPWTWNRYYLKFDGFTGVLELLICHFIKSVPYQTYLRSRGSMSCLFAFNFAWILANTSSPSVSIQCLLLKNIKTAYLSTSKLESHINYLQYTWRIIKKKQTNKQT